jgi:hypothetical protein
MGRVAGPSLEGGQVAVLHLHMGPFPRNRCNIVLMADESAMNFAISAIFPRVGSSLRKEHGASPSRAAEQAASGRSYRLGPGGAIIQAESIIRVLCMPGYELSTLYIRNPTT